MTQISNSRSQRLEAMLDRIEPAAVAISLGVLVVGGVVGAVWDTVGDLMKSGLAVSVLGLPLLLLFRSTHRQSIALARHINESPSAQLSTVSLYEGMRTLSELTAGSRVDAILLARSGGRYLADLRSIDAQWETLRVVVTDTEELDVWKSQPKARGWALHSMVRVSAEPTDVHYLIAGDDCAVVGFYSVYGPGNVDYSHSLLVTPQTAGGRELIDALKVHFQCRWESAQEVPSA
jgi:hypothetical protein